ncbi:hypothetical protein QZH41_019906 [Actinostola sp. cb2023]|nr:hypothetical protein QZH41_019906 [Actinostola sp. cb2023]
MLLVEYIVVTAAVGCTCYLLSIVVVAAAVGAHILLVDYQPPFDADISEYVYQSLEDLFALVCNLSGPCRTPLFGLFALGSYPENLFQLQYVKNNFHRLHSALEELKFFTKDSKLLPESKTTEILHQGIQDAIMQYKRHFQSLRQISTASSQLEICILTCSKATHLTRKIEQMSSRLELGNIKKIQVAAVVKNVGDEDDQGEDHDTKEQDISPPSSTETGIGTGCGIVDTITLQKGPISFKSFFKNWLLDCETDQEHIRIELQSPIPTGEGGYLVLKCDIHERLISPAYLPFQSQFQVNTEIISNAKTQSNANKTSPCISYPVHTMTVDKLIKREAICESVVRKYFTPYVVRPTVCWKLDWEELESNQQYFHAFCNTLEERDLAALIKVKPTYATRPGQPRLPIGYFILLPSHGSTMLLKSIATNELLLPTDFNQPLDGPTNEATEVIAACVDQVIIIVSPAILDKHGQSISMVSQSISMVIKHGQSISMVDQSISMSSVYMTMSVLDLPPLLSEFLSLLRGRFSSRYNVNNLQIDNSFNPVFVSSGLYASLASLSLKGTKAGAPPRPVKRGFQAPQINYIQNYTDQDIMGKTSSYFMVIFAIIAALLAIAVVYFAIPSTPEPPRVLNDSWFGKGEKREQDTSVIKTFDMSVSREVLEDLKHRLLNTRFFETLEDVQWEYGTNQQYMKELVDYWINKYDWKAQEKLINSFRNYETRIDGLRVHFMHIKPQIKDGQKLVPIMFIHGWPGSFIEFYKVIPLLVQESLTGKFAYEIVCPSISGYGFSEASHKPGLNVVTTAAIFIKLMARLGHAQYYVQGGDWGSIISRAMAVMDKRHIKGIFHLNMFVVRAPYGPLSYIAAYFTLPIHEHKKIFPLKDVFYKIYLHEAGYFHIQACLDSHFTKDELLTNVMIYWLTNSIATSMRYYKEAILSSDTWNINRMPIDVPTGLAEFPQEMVIPPKPWVSSIFTNIVHYSVLPKGGHFAALEQPELFMKDVVQFVQKVEVHKSIVRDFISQKKRGGS